MEFLLSNNFEHPEDTLLIGDVVSFAKIEWHPAKDIHTYYDAETKQVTIPDWIILNPKSYMVSQAIDGVEVILDSTVRVELDETFIIQVKYKNRNRNNRYEFRAKSLQKKRFVIFHFSQGWIEDLHSIFRHSEGDTYEDKLEMIRQLWTGESKRARCSEIDQLVRCNEFTITV